MEIAVEISLYPLDRNFIPPIQAFIDRVNASGRFKVVTNSMSTQIFGDHAELLAMLSREMRATFETAGKSVFVMKVLGPLASPDSPA